MTAPASLEDFPHIAQAHRKDRIRVAPDKDKGVVVRTLALSAAALLAPVLAGAVLGVATRAAPVSPDFQVREAPFAVAASTTPAKGSR
jgi:hypothetical protein